MIRTSISPSRLSALCPAFRLSSIVLPFRNTLTPIVASSHPCRPMSSSITGAETSASTLKITSHNQYKTPRLIPSELNPDPLAQFERWLAGALDPAKAGEPEGTPAVHEPEAMVLGTATKEGRPSARVVLLKGASWPHLVCTVTHLSTSREATCDRPSGADSISFRI